MNQKKCRKKLRADDVSPKHADIPPTVIRSRKSSSAGLAGSESSRRDTAWEAQEIIYDAWELSDPRRRVSLARKALEVCADCADAYVILAEERARNVEETIELYRKGVEAGERALGKEVFKKDAGHFWGLNSTRPYMRARAGLAQGLWDVGRREEAVGHYQDMLRLNRNDNQGIRYILLPCLIELGRDEDAGKLFRKYRGDDSAHWKWGRVLLDFRGLGGSRETQVSLMTAMEYNPHVTPLLTGQRKMPRQLPEYYGIGDKDEAVSYVHGSYAAWKASPGALDWLAAQAS